MAVNNIHGGNNATPTLVSDSRNSKAAAAVSGGGQNGPGTPAAPASDSVTLTDTAAQLRSLEKQLASVPVVDTQRVNAVRSEIASGTFVIDPPRVAGKIIQLEGMIASRI